MKISVITPVLNSVTTIEDCIKSLHSQTYENWEHIIVDGCSTDGTLDIIKRYLNKKTILISEPDNGLYDAFNKGIKLASGNIIGILHADDLYAHNKVLEMVANVFLNYDVSSCYGDLLYVSRSDPNKIIRYWKSGNYKPGMFRFGWHPPHTTLFIKKEIYEKYGYFNTDFKIAGDYEIMVRFFERYKITTFYIPSILVKMRVGGKSNKSLKNIIFQTWEDYKAWKINNLKGGLIAVFLKKLIKAPQFILRPREVKT